MSEAAIAAPARDLVLGRYRPLQPLGTGGSGSVWLARDEASGFDVALKIVPREGKAASRAEREASAAARLRHPHILRSYTLARDDRHVYIAYEYVPGRTLRDALRNGELDDHGAIEAAAQVLEALAHAHACGIVHRDVKPTNALLADSDGSVRLLDFGLARMNGEETLTAAGDVPGTLAYISPERLRGLEAGPAADVWAVGVLLWEALAGYHPFWKGSPLETAKRIEAGGASLAKARPDLPKQVIALVGRALATDPARRPTAARLAEALRVAWADERPTRARSELRAPGPDQVLSAAFAALFVGWTAWAIPFYPTGWPFALAAAAGMLTLVRAKLGLALALAIPVLPLGNVSAGLAWVYGALALAWLVLSWREPRVGLLFSAGALLGPIGALGVLPVSTQIVQSRVRRAVYVGFGVLTAGLVAGIRSAPLPVTGEKPPRELGISAGDSPLAAAGALGRLLTDHPTFVVEAFLLALAALALPFARRFGLWGIAAFGAFLLAATVLPASTAIVPALLIPWAVCIGLALRSSLRFSLRPEAGFARRSRRRFGIGGEL
jgi:hypothetical protein